MKKLIITLILFLFAPMLMAESDASSIMQKQKEMEHQHKLEVLIRDGNEILSLSDDKISVSGILLNFEMKVYRSDVLRKTYKMTLKTKGKDRSLLEFTYPPRNQGQKMLRVKDSIWLYRPEINKIIQISGRSDAVGSDFSNNDILFVRLDEDYNAELLRVEDYKGEKAYVLELKAKSESITYARIIYWIRVKDYLPLQRDFYTISGMKLKTLILNVTSDIFEGNPDLLAMSNIMEKEKRSTIQFTYLKTGVVFPDQIFQKNSLIRKR